MKKRIKIILVSFSLALLISLVWNIFKHSSGVSIPNGAIKIDMTKANVFIEKQYTMNSGNCYLIGLWSNGDIFDGKYYFGIADNKQNYNLYADYELKYFHNNKLVGSKKITKNNLKTVSMDGVGKSSKIGLDRFKAPYKDKYNSLKIRLEIKSIQHRLKNNSQNIYFFIEKTKCPDPFWTHKAELRNKKHLLIDNLETNSTLIPLYKALKKKNTFKVKELIENGINPEVKMLGNRRPIHYATFFNDAKTLKYLISKGVALNPKDIFGKTPLHYGIENNATKSVELLLESGANLSLVEKVDNYLKIDGFGNREIPVIVYISMGSLFKMTKILLNNGLNPNYKKKVHSTILTDLKLFHGVANKNLKSKGEPPKYPNYKKMVNLLRKYGAKTEDELKDSNEVQTNTILINHKDK